MNIHHRLDMRPERLDREVHHEDGVFTPAEQEHRPLEAGRDLAHDVDRLGLQKAEVTEAGARRGDVGEGIRLAHLPVFLRLNAALRGRSMDTFPGKCQAEWASALEKCHGEPRGLFARQRPENRNVRPTMRKSPAPWAGADGDVHRGP